MPVPGRLRRYSWAAMGPHARRIAQVAVLPPAAFAVHQLRYMLAFGANAGIELQRTGHSYLHSLVPWLIATLAIAVGVFLQALGRAFAGQTSARSYSASLLGLWLTCSAALLAIFICQEFLEGVFLTGHPAGLQGIFGFGGWWAVPASLCIGLVVAALFHGARWVLHEVARRHAERTRTWTAAGAQRRPAAVLLAPPVPLVSGCSGRGPPA
jgi:hypothetical protein